MKRLTLAFILSATAALFSGGCSQKKSPPAVDDANGGLPKRGTSDSGGGTGVEGKMFESYIVDPTTLPAFKEHLASRIANIKSTDPNDVGGAALFKLKTWYLAPVELEKIDKGLLGVSFMQNSTTQIARQKLREIWISKPIYDAMMPDTLAQATTLAHEWVMSLYMMSFMKMSDLCKTAVVGADSGCDVMDPNFDEIAPPQPTRVLNEEDNENIRFVTDWFMRNTLQPVDEKVFQRVLVAHGFDKRFFDPHADAPGKQSETLKMSREEFVAALHGAKITNLMPDQCTGVTLGQTVKCTLDFKSAGSGLAVNLEVPGQPALSFETYLSDEIELSESGDAASPAFYSITIFSRQAKSQVGDRARFLALIFDKTQVPGQIELRSVVIRTGVIVSIDKKRDPVCFLRVPKIESLLDDGLMIRRAGLKPLFLERYYAGTPPVGLCNPLDFD